MSALVVPMRAKGAPLSSSDEANWTKTESFPQKSRSARPRSHNR